MAPESEADAVVRTPDEVARGVPAVLEGPIARTEANMDTASRRRLGTGPPFLIALGRELCKNNMSH